MPSITLTDPVTLTTVASGLIATNNANLRALLNAGLDAANLKGNPPLIQGDVPVWDGSQFVRPTGTPDKTKVLAGDGIWEVGVIRLYDSTLGADANNFDITAINTTFAHLKLVVYARTDEAATNSLLNVRFNNDSGANYDYQYLSGSGATVTAGETFAATSARIGSAAGNTAGANLFASTIVEISHYAGTANNKTMDCLSSLKLGTVTGNLFVLKLAAFWRSNTAISRITVLPGAGTNFKAGSRCTLYGFG